MNSASTIIPLISSRLHRPAAPRDIEMQALNTGSSGSPSARPTRGTFQRSDALSLSDSEAGSGSQLSGDATAIRFPEPPREATTERSATGTYLKKQKEVWAGTWKSAKSLDSKILAGALVSGLAFVMGASFLNYKALSSPESYGQEMKNTIIPLMLSVGLTQGLLLVGLARLKQANNASSAKISAAVLSVMMGTASLLALAALLVPSRSASGKQKPELEDVWGFKHVWVNSWVNGQLVREFKFQRTVIDQRPVQN